MPINEASWLKADWPAAAHIKAGTTTRIGGVSQSPFNSLNLALHVEDDPEHVAANRQQLRQYLQLPSEPNWLEQVHGCTIAMDHDPTTTEPKQADASMTHTMGVVCAVMTADCLPVLITDKTGSCVAAVHAGWRGLAQGLILKTIDAMSIPKQDLLVWLGPAIGPSAFEVGAEVRDQFVSQSSIHEKAFMPTSNILNSNTLNFNTLNSNTQGQQCNKWFMDIYQVARQQLNGHGVEQVFGGEFCTCNDEERFYSFRREAKTGRMVSLIWMEPHG